MCGKGIQTIHNAIVTTVFKYPILIQKLLYLYECSNYIVKTIMSKIVSLVPVYGMHIIEKYHYFPF